MFCVKYDFWKVDPTFTAAVAHTRCACRHWVCCSQAHPLAPFYIIFTLNSVYRFLSKLHPSTKCFWSFFFFFPPFLCLPNLEDCDATSSHACFFFCVEQEKKDYIHYKLFIVFKKRCLIELPCMLDMYGFFFFTVLEDVLLVGWLTPAWHSYFIYGLPHFFGTAAKKWQDFPTYPPHHHHHHHHPHPHPSPLVIYTSSFQLCWSAPPSAVIRLQWMRLCIPDGSWSAGILHGARGETEKKTPLLKETTDPPLFLPLEVFSLLLQAYIVI